MVKRKVTEVKEAIQEEHANGHYTFCIRPVSPKGFKPLINCNQKIFFLDRRPLRWNSKLASAEDRQVEHVCPEWDMQLLADYRVRAEEIAISRYKASLGSNNITREVISPFITDPVEDKKMMKRRERKLQPKKDKPDLRDSGILFQGKPALATFRKSRLVHQCQAKCATGIQYGDRYLESREEGGTFVAPYRYCINCFEAAGYVENQ